MKLADYVYKIYGNNIFVKDLNLGGISLTNSLERVLVKIQSQENIKDLDIIQVDSQLDLDRVIWDGKDKVSWIPISSEDEKNRLRVIVNQLFD